MEDENNSNTAQAQVSHINEESKILKKENKPLTIIIYIIILVLLLAFGVFGFWLYQKKTFKELNPIIPSPTSLVLPTAKPEVSIEINEKCKLKPDPGTCMAYIPGYYFSESENACKEFIWGGCEGVVPFDTLEECKETCEKEINNDDCQKIQELTIETAFSVTKSLCIKCNGTWGPGPHDDGCNPSSTDSGKVCTDNLQCEGLCLAEDNNKNATSGKCSKERFVFGCNIELEDGKAQPMFCRD